MGPPTGGDREGQVVERRSAFLLNTSRPDLSDLQIDKENWENATEFSVHPAHYPQLLVAECSVSQQLAAGVYTGAISHLIASVMNLPPAAARLPLELPPPPRVSVAGILRAEVHEVVILLASALLASI